MIISVRLILISNHTISLLETEFPNPLENSVNLVFYEWFGIFVSQMLGRETLSVWRKFF